MDSNLIPARLYKKIVELVPIVCVDVILMYKGKCVLVKRADEPLKNHWWIIGGRAYKGEPTVETAKRKVKEEIGVDAYGFEKFGIYEDHYPKSAWGVPTSSVSVVYLASTDNLSPKFNRTVKGIKLSDDLPSRLVKKLFP